MKCPLITMSAVTGKPDKNDIFEYLKGLRDNGIEQILIYPRSGCEIEYLSEEWFCTIDNFIECAKQLDMCLWLYDDFNWPSGDACGRVTAIKEYRLMSIITKGEGIGTISYKSRHNSGLFGEKFFPNLLSPEAVEYFIKCTHEEYYKRFGDDFGTVIKGIFTDEPSIGYSSEGLSIPYYEGIENDYHKLCGRDFSKDMRDEFEYFYLNAITVISNRFNTCYISKLSDWCKNHGIIMTGHLMCDNEPFYGTKHSGRFLKSLSSFMLPGIDEIYTSFDDASEMTLLGSAEYASGSIGAMAELFALGPCDMSYAKKRCMLYLTASFKINHYFLAISHVDMRGNMLVTDFFNNFNTDQPDFSGMRLLAKEAEKSAEYASKDFTADVYIRYPFSACAKNITDNVNFNFFWSLVNKLTYKGVQWKLIDDESPTNAPIIEVNNHFEFMLNGTVCDADEICKKINGKITITDESGLAPSGIFVRKFDDGSIIILNLFAPSGKYTINGKEIFLDRYDVRLSNESLTCKREEFSPAFKVSYGNDNIIRAMFVNSEEIAQVYCEKDFDVTIAVRKNVDAYLNGQAISCHKNAEILSNGFKNLYKISEPVSLKKGLSIIKAQNDFKYMPSVFIIGDFSADSLNGKSCRVELRPRKSTFSCKDSICDYGRLEFTADSLVPYNAIGIELVGTELYTTVYADDILLGEKIASPYVFNIDKALWGKNISLKIIQLSSMGNIFGNVDYWDSASKKSQWRGTPTPQKTQFGFKKINWIIKK